MKSKATKKAVKAATESSNGMKRFKWDDNRVSGEFLILAPVKDDMGAVFTAKNHEYWANGRPMSRSGTPSYTAKNGGEATGEKDKIVETGWKLRDKYGNSKNEKKKDFWKKFLLRTSHNILVLDLKNVEAGPMVWSLPQSVSDVVLDEIKDALSDEDGDLSSICDFDEGRRLFVKTNGLKGKKRKYKVVKFKEPVNLIEDGAIEEDDLEEIEEKMADLSSLQLQYKEELFEKHYEFLKEKGKKIGIDIEDLDDDEEESEDGDEYEEDDEGLEVDEEDLNIEDEEDEEESEDEEEDEEEDEPPKKPKKVKGKKSSEEKKKPAKDTKKKRGVRGKKRGTKK